MWAHYFGVGFVDPVDDFSIANPPSNARLLDRLAADFVQSGFDVRRLERSILNSQTYQFSATPNRTNRQDRRNYSRSYVRVMPAEVAVDSLQTALGATFDFGPDVPANSRAIEIAPNVLRRSEFARVFRIFERPERKTACDCERKSAPNIRQSLYLTADAGVLAAIESGRLKKLPDNQSTDEAIIEELFLATLSRLPNDEEQGASREHLQKGPDRTKAAQALFWSLINTREFLTNH